MTAREKIGLLLKGVKSEEIKELEEQEKQEQQEQEQKDQEQEQEQKEQKDQEQKEQKNKDKPSENQSIIEAIAQLSETVETLQNKIASNNINNNTQQGHKDRTVEELANSIFNIKKEEK